MVAAYIFGSHGTSKQTPLSDIDLCLFTTDTDKETILELSSFGSDELDVSLFDNLLIGNILKEGEQMKEIFLLFNRQIYK